MINNLVELNAALNNEDEYKRLVQNSLDLERASKQFPEYADALIQPLFANQKIYDRIIGTSVHLERIGKQFPEYAYELIQQLLANQKQYNNVIMNSLDLERFDNVKKSQCSLKDQKYQKHTREAPRLERYPNPRTLCFLRI